MSTSYGASTTRRSRRTKAQVEQLEQQIYDVLRMDHPQSVRHVFYRMTDPRLAEPVEKSDRGYRHVQHRCLEMRRSDVIPYRWISDSSRAAYHVQTYGGTGDFLKRVAGTYRADLWSLPDVPTYASRRIESVNARKVLGDHDPAEARADRVEVP